MFVGTVSLGECGTDNRCDWTERETEEVLDGERGSESTF